MDPTHIVIHHSLTKDSETVSWGAIRDWHTGRNPASPHRWLDIGYHTGLELIGDYYELLLGRMIGTPGAHCREMGMNRLGIGFCLVGNFDLAPPPEAQWQRALAYTRHMAGLYEIPRDNVIGHREAGARAGYDWTKGQYKSCPGKFFDMDRFRGEL